MHSAEDAEGRINRNIPSWLVVATLFVVAAVCVVGLFWSSTVLLQGMFVSGGVAAICVAAGLIWIEVTARRRLSVVRAAMLTVVTRDPDHAFLTDVDGNVIAWNKHASDKFGDVEGKSIGGLFTSILVNPDAALFRLLEHADTFGSGKEDIVTRGGHYRLILTKVDEDTYLWRLEETGKAKNLVCAIAIPYLSPCLQLDRGVQCYL